MVPYLLRRLLQAVPIWIGITLITFVLMNVIPGDPVSLMMDEKAGGMETEVMENIRAKWGLDQPKSVQYLRFLQNAVQGDLGTSYRSRVPVTQTLMERMPVTIRLAAGALLIALVIGIPTGVVAAVRHRRAADTAVMVGAMAGISMPGFFLGYVLMYVLAVRWPLLPPSGYDPGDLRYLILPSITLGAVLSGVIARMTRSAMLEAILQQYVNTARAKGLREWLVILRHAFRSAMVSVTTVVGVQLAGLLAGAVITESVFGLPGLGRLLLDAINQRDLPVVQGGVVVMATAFLAVSLLTDLLNALLDPRIRLN